MSVDNRFSAPGQKPMEIETINEIQTNEESEINFF